MLAAAMVRLSLATIARERAVIPSFENDPEAMIALFPGSAAPATERA
jgi:hypothetical protein